MTSEPVAKMTLQEQADLFAKLAKRPDAVVQYKRIGEGKRWNVSGVPKVGKWHFDVFIYRLKPPKREPVTLFHNYYGEFGWSCYKTAEAARRKACPAAIRIAVPFREVIEEDGE